MDGGNYEKHALRGVEAACFRPVYRPVSTTGAQWTALTMKNMRSGVWKPPVSGRFTGLYQQLELNGRR